MHWDSFKVSESESQWGSKKSILIESIDEKVKKTGIQILQAFSHYSLNMFVCESCISCAKFIWGEIYSNQR
jgi:hypothetical protein